MRSTLHANHSPTCVPLSSRRLLRHRPGRKRCPRSRPVEAALIRRLCSTASHLIQVCLALFSIGATAAGPKTITLANGEWPPYTSESLPDYGSVSRLVTAAFAHEGIKVNYVFFPWKRALEDSRAGKLDGTLIWARTDYREADFLYSDAVLTTNYVLFFRKDKPVHWN